MEKKTGALITLFAGICWGFSGSIGQYIFSNFEISEANLTAYRMLFAGIIIIIIGLLTDRDNMIAIWKDKRAVLRMVFFAIFGILFNQYAYLCAIANSNSGTATILMYIGPVIVMVISCLTAKRLPTIKEAIAIVMVVVGSFLIATHGHISSMVLAPAGLAWGLIAAVAMTCYTLLPGDLLHRFGSVAITGYGMTIGGIIMFIGTRAWSTPLIMERNFLIAFGGMVVLGTVITFTCYMIGVKLIGPVKASMLACIEPVAATVIMIVWFNEPFGIIDFAGFMCIFVTIFLLTKKESE